MATVKPAYSGSATAITVTLASLASTSYRQSAGQDNTTNLYMEAILTGKLKTGASGTSATGIVNIYLASYDGTQYSNNASGSDASFTVDLQQNLTQIYQLSMQANATTYYLPGIAVAAAAGLPCLPNKWSLIFYNGTGAALDSTGGNFVIEFQGINYTVA